MTRQESIAVASDARRTIRHAAELLAGAFASPPEISFVHDLPLDVQRQVADQEGAPTRVQHYFAPPVHGVIESIEYRVLGLRVHSQCLRDPTLEEARSAAPGCALCAAIASMASPMSDRAEVIA